MCAIASKDNAVSSLTYNYVFTDHLGSIVKLTDNTGTTIAEQNFDAWGRLRDANNWSSYTVPNTYAAILGTNGGTGWLTRGYTGHEHIPQVDLINMNGRMYDAVLGRMLSADKYVTDASNSQAYNRYSYVLNNPLKYTDPSGWRLRYAPPEDIARESGDEHSGGGGGAAEFMSSYNDLVGPGSNLTSWGSTMLGGTFYAPSAQYYINSVSGNYMFGNQVITKKQYDEGKAKNEGRVSYYWSSSNSRQDYLVPDKDASPQENSTIGYGVIIANITEYFLNTVQTNFDATDFGLTSAGMMNDMLLLGVAQAGYVARNSTIASEIAAIKVFEKIAGGAKGLKYAGGLGVGLTAMSAVNEFVSGKANTHTFVDVIVTGGLIIAGIGATPAFVFGLAGAGFVYGAFSAFGGDALVDKLSENWGRNLLYPKKR